MSEEITNIMELLKFWTIGTFVMVWVSITTFVALQTGEVAGAILDGTPFWGAAAGLCTLWYVICKTHLRRTSGG